jgi:hypothetical protein
VAVMVVSSPSDVDVDALALRPLKQQKPGRKAGLLLWRETASDCTHCGCVRPFAGSRLHFECAQHM